MDRELGTGLFAIGNPNEFHTAYVGNVTYDGFLAQLRAGPPPFVYQWVPHRIASMSELKGVKCEAVPCAVEGSWCEQPGCFCVDGICANERSGP